MPEAWAALADLERVHRRLFGRWSVRRTLARRLDGDGSRPRWLDLGAGSGHVAADLQRLARRRGVALRVVAVDRRLAHLAAGRRQRPGIVAVAADAERLPFADAAFAGAYSHLFLHHFDDPTNRGILDEMERVSRGFVAVVDLRRSRLLAIAARVFLRALGLGRLAYEDGLLSVANSYTVDEIRRLVDGRRVEELRRRFPGRLALVLDGGGAASGEPAPRG